MDNKSGVISHDAFSNDSRGSIRWSTQCPVSARKIQCKFIKGVMSVFGEIGRLKL